MVSGTVTNISNQKGKQSVCSGCIHSNTRLKIPFLRKIWWGLKKKNQAEINHFTKPYDVRILSQLKTCFPTKSKKGISLPVPGMICVGMRFSGSWDCPFAHFNQEKTSSSPISSVSEREMKCLYLFYGVTRCSPLRLQRTVFSGTKEGNS